MAVPLVCHGHSRPVVDLFYSPVTPDGFFLISASKGMCSDIERFDLFSCVWIELHALGGSILLCTMLRICICV